MEAKVDFNGKRYWKKVQLSDSVFGIEQIITQYTLMLSNILLINDKERKERRAEVAGVHVR
jgi:hypothetical protein